MSNDLKTWPLRIWLQHQFEYVPSFEVATRACSEITWCQDSVEQFDVEYVRADSGVMLEPGSVPIPTSVDMARMMLALGHNYLTEHAPDQLRATPTPTPAVTAKPAQPELTVWEGAMHESNGKSNFTAILNRKEAKGIDTFSGFTIARSEYPDRVRYEADCVRYLIGELAEKPWITDYDADKHSGYVAPPVAAEMRPDLAKLQLYRCSSGGEMLKAPGGHYFLAADVERLLATTGEKKWPVDTAVEI